MERFRSFDALVVGVMALLLAVILFVAAQNRPTAAASTQIIFTRLDEQYHEQLFSLSLPLEELDRVDSTVGIPIVDDNAVQLSDGEASVWDFSVSSDRSQIAYSALNQEGGSDLWRSRGQGEAPEYLIACPNASCNSPAWSPDGRFLAFTRRSTDATSGGGGLTPPRLWLLNLESGETAQVFADNQILGFNPLWSASGQWLSYLSPELNGVSLYNLNDGQSRFFKTDTGEPGVWHPTEDKFLLSILSQVDDQYRIHLYLADPSNDELINLSGDLAVEDTSATWSPNGEQISFRRKELEGATATLGKQLWIMDEDGTASQRLTLASDFDHGQPTWSLDGKWLLYHRFPLRGPEIVFSIWLTDVNSGEHLEIVRSGQRPMWFQ
ncbi:MAG: hypothetical protein AAF702_25645 [Chloroflexota bacterium]